MNPATKIECLKVGQVGEMGNYQFPEDQIHQGEIRNSKLEVALLASKGLETSALD